MNVNVANTCMNHGRRIEAEFCDGRSNAFVIAHAANPTGRG